MSDTRTTDRGCPIVRTPLVEVPADRGHRVGLKLEALQLTGSIKGRTATGLLSSLVASGRARPGDVVVESSSGNLGAAVAELAPAFDLGVVIVGDPKMPLELRDRIRAAGARLEFVDSDVDPARFLEARLALVADLRALPRHHWLDQYANPAAQAVHYATTGPEILDQACNQLGGLDVVVVPVSTGGTISGMARFVKRRDASIRVVAADVEGSAIFGGAPAPRLLNGVGASLRPPNVDLGVIDEHELVDDASAIAACRALLREAGLFVGGSSGAALVTVDRIASRERNLRIAALMPDGGWSYRDSLFNDAWLSEHGVTLP